MKLVRAMSVLALLAVSQPAAATNHSKIPEEDYDFLSVTTGPCIPTIGIGIEPKHRVECERITPPRRYRGTWFVAFETSYFTPIGKRSCIETKGLTTCAELRGTALPWPSRWACPRKFEIEFIGRRNNSPGFDPAYQIVVDEVVSMTRLPNPPYEADECDPAAR